MTREPFPPLTAEEQSRLMARSVREPYAAWIKRQCDRWGMAWREMYAVPLDDKPQPKGNANG